MEKRRLRLACLFLCSFLATSAALPGSLLGQDHNENWLDWRGPKRNGIMEGQTPPTEWSADKNVNWKAELSGRGHASPCIAGNQIVIASADSATQKQYVASYDFETGGRLWETLVNEGNFLKKIFPTNTHASSTVVSDGERFFAVLCNNDAAQVVALAASWCGVGCGPI